MTTARKLLATATALILLVCFALLPAAADEFLQIQAHWGEGNEPVPAQRLEGEDYWIQLPYEAFGTPVTLEFTDAYGRYASWYSEQCDAVSAGLLTVREPMNTGTGLLDEAAVLLNGCDELGNVLTAVRVFLSSEAAPEQAAPGEVSVEIVYQTEDGFQLGRETVAVAPGGSETVYPNNYDGYMILSGPATVSVDGSGTPSQAQVVFLYRAVPAAPSEVTVSVVFQAENGIQLGTDQVTIAAGDSRTISAKEFGGYVLADYSPAEVTVSVDGSGNASQSQVTFTYRALPASATVNVIYQAENGAQLGTDQVTIPTGGSQAISAKEFGGYVLADYSPAEVTVTVDGSGNASQSQVTFTYRALPASATVNVIYQAENGAQLGTDQVTIPTGGSQAISAKEFAGYVLADLYSSPVTVTVDGGGYPSRSEVTFVYRALPDSAAVDVIYAAEDGTQLGRDSVTIKTGTSGTVNAKPFDGYALAEGMQQSVTVTVDAYGVPNTSQVTFIYHALPATVLIQYVTQTGEQLYAETATLERGGSRTFEAKQFEGYVLADASGAVTVKVDGNGRADPPAVTFTYRPLPDSATVRVSYRNTDGLELDNAVWTVARGVTETIEARTFDGYVLMEGTPASATVTVNALGEADKTEVIFTYRALPGQADVAVISRTEGGEQIERETRSVPRGQSLTIEAKAIAGYVLAEGSPASVTVNVNALGEADKTEVIFTYRALPDSASVTVLYTDEAGTVIEREARSVGRGEAMSIEAKAIDGYILAEGSVRAVLVTVNDLGVADKTEVTFIYRALPGSANVTVLYKAEDGQTIGQDTVSVARGQSAVIEAKAIAGYVLAEGTPASVTVNVSETGEADRTEVIFTYRALPDSVPVTVLYKAEDGQTIGQDTVSVARGQSQTIEAKAIAGYVLAEGSPASATVTVSETGEADRTEVTFTYRALPDSVPVTVLYKAENGQTIETETRPVPRGQSITIEAKAISGYAHIDGEPAAVTVTANEMGVADRTEVTFTYRALPESATVTVTGRTEDGTQITQETRAVARGTSAVIEAKAIDGYTLAEGSPASVTVTVNELGVADQTEITFTYRALPDTASVTVVYQTEEQLQLGTEVRSIARGASAQIQAKAFDGYVLAESCPASVDVHVDALGAADRPVVTFTYIRVTGAGVTVRFQNIRGQDIVPPYTLTLEGGSEQTVTPDPERIPNDYDAKSVTPAGVTVKVSVRGEATPNTVVFTFARLKDPTETKIPLGLDVQRWAKTTAKGVNIRRSMDKNSGRVTEIKNTGSYVWVIREDVNDKNERWAHVLYNGKEGYIRSDFLDILSQAETDDHQDTLTTPVPTYTPQPATPTPVPVTPGPTPEPEIYRGYALVIRAVQLQDSVLYSSNAMMELAPNTLVTVNGQFRDDYGVLWSNVSTLDEHQGFVEDTVLYRIDADRAQPYIDAYARAHSTPVPTPAPTPAPVTGFFKAREDGVLLHQQASSISVNLRVLNKNDVVYVTGQEYDTGDGYPWHMTVLEQGSDVIFGYVRSDMLVMLTQSEIDQYLSGGPVMTPAPIVSTPAPAEQALSSYGVVRSNGPARLRNQPTINGSTVNSTVQDGTLCYIMQSQEGTDGYTWYSVHVQDNSGKSGWIRGDLLTTMTIDEYIRYLETKTDTSRPSATAAPTPVPMEQQIVEDWKASGVPYATFSPIATTPPIVYPETQPAPETDPENIDPLPGQDGTLVTPETPTPTPSGWEEPVREPEQKKESGGPSPVLIIVIVLLVLGGGAGAAAYFHNKNKRAAARRAAWHRAQANRNGQNAQQRPENAYQQPTGGAANTQRTPAAGTASRPAGQPVRNGTAPNPTRPTGTPTAPTTGVYRQQQPQTAQNPYQRPSASGGTAGTYGSYPSTGSVQRQAPAAAQGQTAAPAAPGQAPYRTAPDQTIRQTPVTTQPAAPAAAPQSAAPAAPATPAQPTAQTAPKPQANDAGTPAQPSADGTVRNRRYQPPTDKPEA
ncbi:MAG: MucBP domain-containing protein [Clostridia bacterium]|nr:MucBP domain-containing protein [Clostridia bacterium]